jgi:hypothetical protein
MVEPDQIATALWSSLIYLADDDPNDAYNVVNGLLAVAQSIDRLAEAVANIQPKQDAT